MIDKGHTRIGTEVFSRRGRYDAVGSFCSRNELRPFYSEQGILSQSVASLPGAEDDTLQLSELHEGASALLSPPREEQGGLRNVWVEQGESELGDDEGFDRLCKCEVENEAAFEDVVRSLDLQNVKPILNHSGDLELPNGNCVARRQQFGSIRYGGRRFFSILASRHGGARGSIKKVVRSGSADVGQLEAILTKMQAERLEWTGVTCTTRSGHSRAPRLTAPVEKKVFDVRTKMNNERGHGCVGQGKRHQNAAVHTQPKKHGGRLAKWSSAPKCKAAFNATQES